MLFLANPLGAVQRYGARAYSCSRVMIVPEPGHPMGESCTHFDARRRPIDPARNSLPWVEDRRPGYALVFLQGNRVQPLPPPQWTLTRERERDR